MASNDSAIPSGPSGGEPLPETAAEPSPPKKERVFWRRARKVAALLLIILSLIGVAGGLFIQLPIFKRLVIRELVDAVESSTNGTLAIGEIKGNFLEGFVMENVTLRLKTGTKYDSIPLVHVDRILASYSIMRWLRRSEIGVTSMVMVHPVIRFVKFGGDTTWNFSLLTKPVPTAPKGPPKPFTQIVDLSRFEIENGSFYMRDYNQAPKSESALRSKSASAAQPAIDWSDVEAEEIDLESRFYARGEAMQSARVHHLSFIEKKSGFFVSHLEFSGYLDSLQARMEGAKITTGHSAIGFSVEVAKPRMDSITIGSLRHSFTHVSLKGPVIGTSELKQFLPGPLGFLGGSPGIDLDATGEFGKLKIKELTLDLKNHGNISIAGEIDNLHHPDSLELNIHLQARNLSNASLDEYVPGLHLPNLVRCGTIDIPSLTYVGEPLNFHSKFDARSSGAGNVAADVNLDLRNHHIQYRASASTKNFNIAAIVLGKELESSITAEAKLAGHGTDWKTMNSSIAAKTDGPSSFGTYRVNALDLSGTIDRGTISTDHLAADFEGGPTLDVANAMVGLTTPSLPFRFNGTVKNLLLSNVVTSQKGNPVRIDFDADVLGTARTFENMSGTAHVHLYDLEYQGHALPDDTATITMRETAPNDNTLTLESNMADVTIERRFQIGDLLHTVPDHIQALVAAIEDRNFSREAQAMAMVPNCADSTDFDYHVQVNDLRPLADFLPETFLLARGTISGKVQGCRTGDISLTSEGDSLTFVLRERTSIDSTLLASDTAAQSMDSAELIAEKVSTQDSAHDSARWRMHRKDSLALSLPKFEEGIPRIQAMPTSFRLALDHLSEDPKTALAHLDASFQFSTDSVLRLGSALCYRPSLRATYKNEAMDFDFASLYNDVLGVHLEGDAQFPNGNFDVDLDTMNVSYLNPYYLPDEPDSELRYFIWKNESPTHILFEKNGTLTIDTLNIVHPLDNYALTTKADTMSLGGTISNDSVRAWAKFPSFSLADLKKILPFNPNAKTFDFTSYAGTVRNFEATMHGTLEKPELTAQLFVDTMSYNSGSGSPAIRFDSNSVNLAYRNDVLQGTMVLHVDTLEGAVPSGFNVNTLRGSELSATIQSIPVVIVLKRGPGYAADSARTAGLPVSASIHATNFPLDVATPFLPPFRQILGTGDIDFTVSGSLTNINYTGQASIHDGALLLASTNMWYLFGGPITFANNELVLQNDSVRNIPADDPAGGASLNGSFTFKGFDVTNFDLRLRSDRLMVLSDAAKETLPVAYGPVTISTGGGDFRFYNTFDAPKISGTIDILNANVTMPQSSNTGQTVSGEGVIYETLPRVTLASPPAADTTHSKSILADDPGSPEPTTVNDTLFPNAMKDIFRNDDGTLSANESNLEPTAIATSANPLAPTFVDKLRMKLQIDTRGTADITIPFPGISILNAELKADLKPGGTMTIDRGNNLETFANGSFELSDKSTFSYLKTFTITSGTVTFTNDFTNPNLDIEAEYTDLHHPPNGQPAQDQVKIELDVTGTKNHPQIAINNFEQTITGGDFDPIAEASPEAAQEDAIYFLTTGTFKHETANSNAALANLLPSLGGQLAGNFLKNLTGSTSSVFAIQSASLNLGNNYNSQITAAVFRNITLKVAAGETYTGVGTSTGPWGLNTVETDIPMTALPFQSIANSAFARNALIELQYTQNPTNATAAPVPEPEYLAKVIYNIPLDKLSWLWPF